VGVEYGVLGLLEVLRDGEPLNVGGPRQRIVLSLLLLDVDRVVSMDRLVNAVWNDVPPATARSQVQICVSSLRQRLAARSEPNPIVTRSPGYCLQLGPDDRLDLRSYSDLVATGRAAISDGRAVEAVEAFRSALRLWRGTLLDGPGSTTIRDHGIRLEEQRSAVLEECLTLELQLGRGTELIAELRGEVERDPLRERLRAHLMVALYQAGRQADALRQYREARQVSVDELGIEPTEELQRLEQAILCRDAGLDVVGHADDPRAVPVDTSRPAASLPRLLPADIADFTGRDDTVDELVRLLAPGRAAPATPQPVALPVALPVAIVTGRDGVGKSSLAVHVAHRLAPEFPDGQLYADLHGAHGATGPERVLERFLRALGVVATAIPDGLDERAELYRDRLAGRQVLVCLDDAVSESQIGPLLPGTAGCAVIVTSRRRLAAVPGAVLIGLDPFDGESSLALLSRVIGAGRVRADPEGAASLVRHCANLPLAVRIAAARLGARPHWTLALLVDRLADEESRLDELTYGDLAVRSSVSLTYETLQPDARRLFRLLSLLDAPEFGRWIVGPMLDTDPAKSHDLLEELVDMHLLGVDHCGERYWFHDLVRVFARERSLTEDPVPERFGALSRALGALLYLTEDAHRRLYGGDYLILHGDGTRYPLDPATTDEVLSDTLAWYEREHIMIVAAVKQAAALGTGALVWDLAVCAVTGFEAHTNFQDWRETHEVALEAARRDGDQLGEAAMLYSTGSLDLVEQRLPEAEAMLAKAQTIFERIGSVTGVALVQRNRAFLDRLAGRHDAAEEQAAAALRTFRSTGDPLGQAHSLKNLAQLDLDLGRDDDALTKLSEAAAICAELGNRRMSAQVRHRIGETLLARGDLAGAGEAFAHVLTLARSTNDQVGEAYALLGRGMVELGRRDSSAAQRVLRRAEQLALDTGEPRIRGQIDMSLGQAALSEGRRSEAQSRFEQAVRRFRGMPAPALEARALLTLGDLHAGVEASGQAEQAWHAALTALDGIDPAVVRDLMKTIDSRLGDRTASAPTPR